MFKIILCKIYKLRIQLLKYKIMLFIYKLNFKTPILKQVTVDKLL